MSADILRRAAALLREKSEKATPGPWLHERNLGRLPANTVLGPVRGVGRDLPVTLDALGRDAAFIATMHPGVGLALADWLDWTFDQGHSGDMDDNGCDECRPALAVARLILGESS